MRRVVDSSPIGIVIIDEAGAIETINAAATELFGHEEHETLGRPFAWFLGISAFGGRDAGEDDIIQSTLSDGGTHNGQAVTGTAVTTTFASYERAAETMSTISRTGSTLGYET